MLTESCLKDFYLAPSPDCRPDLTDKKKLKCRLKFLQCWLKISSGIGFMMNTQTATTLFHVADYHIQSAHRIPLASQSKNQNIRTEYPEKNWKYRPTARWCSPWEESRSSTLFWRNWQTNVHFIIPGSQSVQIYNNLILPMTLIFPSGSDQCLWCCHWQSRLQHPCRSLSCRCAFCLCFMPMFSGIGNIGSLR